MRFRICEAEQGTPEWLADRLGCVTGSPANVIYAAGKCGAESVQRENYRYELAEQRVTLEVKPQGFVSDAIKWGNDQEPFARMAYEGLAMSDVKQVGFIRLLDQYAGCSVDGLEMAGDVVEGIQEFKCPMLKTHIAYIKAGVLPAEYKWQVVHNLWVTEAKWCDFMSYRPGFTPFLIRVHAKDMPIEEHGKKVAAFLAEVEQCENEIRSYAE